MYVVLYDLYNFDSAKWLLMVWQVIWHQDICKHHDGLNSPVHFSIFRSSCSNVTQKYSQEALL